MKSAQWFNGMIDGEPEWIHGRAKRFWFWGPDRENRWLATWKGSDEYCNPTRVIETKLGCLIFISASKVRTRTCDECVAGADHPACMD